MSHECLFALSSHTLLLSLVLLEGSGGTFYQWSRGVQIRANLDLLIDWAHGAGLNDLAHSYLLKLSSVVNLLAMPKENLLQVSDASIFERFLQRYVEYSKLKVHISHTLAFGIQNSEHSQFITNEIPL